MKFTRWQRLLCLILAWVLVIQAAPIRVSAQTEKPGEETAVISTVPAEEPVELKALPRTEEVCEAADFTYTALDEETCEVTGYKGTASAVVIPDRLDGLAVVRIGKSAFSGKSIHSVEIPETVTALGDRAFYDCDGLETIDLPQSLTSLGSYVFCSCGALTQLTIPTGVTEIPERAFSGCSKLSDVVLPEGLTTIGSYAFSGCDALETIDLPEGLTAIGSNAFNDCDGLETIDLPQSLTSLGNYVFYYCDALTEITIPTGVTAIPEYAFYGCSKLSNVVLPEGLTTIGSNAFNGCDALERIDLPEGLTAIGSYAFSGCDGLETIVLPQSLTRLGSYVFYNCDALTQLTIPTGVTKIPYHAFSGCAKLSNVVLPEGVTTIGLSAFYNCVALVSIDLPQSLTSLGSSIFSYCDALAEIAIPAGVTTIGTSAFYDCDALVSIDLPEGVTKIDYMAFGDCTALEEINLPDSLTQLADNVFKNCDGLTAITLPRNLKNMGKSVFADCDGLETIELPQSLVSMGTGVFSGCDALTHVRILGSITAIPDYTFDTCKQLSDVELPRTVTSIGYCAFKSCAALPDIDLPESLTALGSYAFAYCDGLETVELSRSLTTISGSAFYDCDGLTQISIPDSVTDIGDGAFTYCSQLETVDLPENLTTLRQSVFKGCDSLVSITIPDSVSKIDNDCFDGCDDLRTVRFPAGLTVISGSAFRDCISLESVSLLEGLTSLGSGCFQGCTSLVWADLPEGLTTILGYAFYGCSALRSIEIPASVTRIEDYAFYGCTSLLGAVIYDSVTSIGNNSFRNCPELTIQTIPGSYVWDYAVSRNINVVDMEDGLSVLWLDVKDTSGDTLEEGFTVSWYRSGEDEAFATGTILRGLESGSYEYELILEDELGFEYVQPRRQTVEVRGGAVELELVLKPLSLIWLTGTVKDAAGTPIPGAKLTLVQTSGSAERAYEAATDAGGIYAVRLCALDTTGTISADGYFGRELSLELSGCTTDIEYGAELIPLPNNKITVQLSVRRAGSTLRTDLPGSDVDLRFRVENLTRGTTVTGHEFQHGSLILPEGAAAANDALRITASDLDGVLADAAVEIRLDAQKNGTARLEFVEHGRFELTELTGCENVAMLLFDASGLFAASCRVGDGYLSEPLKPGSYSVVLMEVNDLIRSTDKLENLTTFGLEAGVDYTVSTVRISDGEITRSGSVFVPVLDPDRFSYTVEENTSFTVNENTPFAGEYIVLRLAYEIDEKHAASGEKIRIRLAEEMGMAGESLTLDGKRYMYSVDGNELTVDTDQRSGIIRLYIQPNFVGRYCVEATLQFASGEKVLTQPLGSVELNVVAAEYDLTDKTCNGKVPVVGTAIPDSTIVFYEWGERIATTTSNAAGSFRAELPLQYVGRYSYHEITATVENDRFDQPLEVEAQTVINDADYAMVSKVTMISGATKIVLDYLYPGAPPAYGLPRVYGWTYIVEFVDDGARKVENVVVHLDADSWSDRGVVCVYDEANDRWVGTGGDPYDVSVSYDIIYPEIDEDAPLELDDELIDQATEEYEKYLEEIEKELEEVEEEDPAVFEDMTLDQLFVYITKYNQLAKAAADDLDHENRTVGNGTIQSDGTTISVNLGENKGDITPKPGDPETSKNPEDSGYDRVATGDRASVYEKDNGNGVKEVLVIPEPSSGSAEDPVVFTVAVDLPDLDPEGDYDATKAYLDTLEDNLKSWLNILGEYYDEYDYPAQLKKLEDMARDNKNAENALKEAKKKIGSETDPKKKADYQSDYEQKSKQLQNNANKLNNTKKSLAWKRIGMKGMMSFLGIAGLIDSIGGLKDKMDTLKRIGEAMPTVCPGDEAAYNQLSGMIDGSAKYIGATGAMSIGADVISVAASVGMITVAPVGFAAKVAFDGAIMAGQIALDQQTDRMLDQLEARLGALDCNGDGQPDGYKPEVPKDDNRTIKQPVTVIVDPSGYVYEAVPSNRVEGVKASCYYLGYALDEYGIPREEPEDILWNAEDYDQINPVYTDENGQFKWDVPEGKWIVKFSKEGYYDTDSSNDPAAVDGYLPVPPPQLDVNTAIVSKAAPEVESVSIYGDQIRIRFSQYMQPDTVTGKTVTVTSGGKPVAGTLRAANAEYNYEQTARYASAFTFVPAEKLEGTVDIQISGCINYAGKAMTDVYAYSGKVQYRPEEISVRAEYKVYWNENHALEIRILPVHAGANQTVSVRVTAPAVLGCTLEQVTTDEAGKAVLPLTGLLPGSAQVILELVGTDLSAAVDVTVAQRSMETEQCEKVTANLPSGSVVEAGTALILRTATEGAQIYYTLDGTCPCVEDSPSRILYTGPIVLTEDAFIIAYAVKEGFKDSATAGFMYTVKPVNPFVDVQESSFYYEPVLWAVRNGITAGTTPTTFGPGDKCMRAHVVTFLWRALGSPEPTGTDNPFVDVKPTDFYYKPVLWALENGITAGLDAAHFGPTAYCNRAQVVTFLYRTMGSPEVGAAANPFTDVAAGSFYERAVLWAVENGVTAGLSATGFGPNSICNRAQIVTFLYRAYNK